MRELAADHEHFQDRRPLWLALGLSLIAHAWLATSVSLPQAPPLGESLSRVLEFSLVRPTAPVPDIPLKPIQPSAQRLPLPLATAPTPEQVPKESTYPTTSPPDAITLPNREQWRLWLAPAEEETATVTATGAVVTDPELLEILNRAFRHDGHVPGAGDTPQRISYEGGSFTYFVKQGNSCFYVREANPLEVNDVAMWYHVSCK